MRVIYRAEKISSNFSRIYGRVIHIYCAAKAPSGVSRRGGKGYIPRGMALAMFLSRCVKEFILFFYARANKIKYAHVRFARTARALREGAHGGTMKRHLVKILILALAAVLLAAILIACDPVETPYSDPFPIVEGPENENYKDHTTKEQAIDRAVDSMENLLRHLDSEEAGDTGYFVGANITINTENGSAFRLNLQANLYTYPYEIKDENGNVILDPDTGLPLVDEEALAIHNDIIRYSDMILEWYDGSTNEMLIGFYFDGINPNSVDDGNDLYLNLQGSKRIFRDFGNSVLYQQIIRLITNFNLETLIGSASDDGTADSSFQSLRDALNMAVDNNYKQTINGSETSIFFDAVNLGTVTGDITSYMQSIFSPFEDKLDPLSNKYLGFLISTLGNTSFTSMSSDMEFRMEPNENLDNLDIMSALVLDVSGGSEVSRTDPVLGTVRESVPYTAHIEANYSVRISSNITFDKLGYTEYDYGNYEYTGDMYIPMLDLQLDVLLRTDINEVDNSINQVYMTCRDLATDDLMMGLYYVNELTYVDVEGIQDLYGGVQIEDLGLPKAYRGGFDLADTMAWLFDLIDEYIVIAVDNILYGQSSSSDDGDSLFAEITSVIIDNMEATMRDESDPSSRATEQIRIDFEMIRTILSLTSETGTEYTTEQLILLINNQFNIDIEAIASIMGISIEELIETTYFYLTYDVDYYSIRVEVYSTAEMTDEEVEEQGPNLIMRLDLYPQHIGEYVRIVFPDFSDFKPFQEVMTYSGYMEGQFIFAATEEVDLSQLLGSFMGDESGLNTPFILPEAADIYFTLYYDQYIREQNLENGRWTRRSRSAFSLYLYMVVGDVVTPLAHVYANDVSLNTADPVEELGYIWLQYDCIEGMPRFKVREDHFIRGFYAYMGYDFDAEEDDDVVLGLTDIVSALMEDSWATFEPDVIRITTSNQTIKDFFRVDELIGTISVQIGFRQRVRNIDQLEVTFAMYTVGNLADMEGDSVYNIRLHDTVEVYFDFGNRVVTKDFYFLYDEDSIAVTNDRVYYMPAMKNLFMGVSRDYHVHILTEMGRQEINSLVSDSYTWEPLEPVPDHVAAYYGANNLTYDYPADFNLHAVYDIPTGYYTVLSDEGYEVVYDLENDLYVIGLGSNAGYARVWDELNSDVPYYYKEYQNSARVSLMYDFGMREPGWYIVTQTGYDDLNILYNADGNYYVVETAELRQRLLDENFGQYEVEVRVPNEETSDPTDYITETQLVPATIYTFTTEAYGQTFYFDPAADTYVRAFVEEITDENGTVTSRSVYRAVYNMAENYIYAGANVTGAERNYLYGLFGNRVLYTLDWNAEPYVGVNWTAAESADTAFADYTYGEVDWNDDIFSSLTWTDMTWDDITINGGIFVVYVVIGDGMMATYRENVRVKILNREIDTDRYVNINTEDGRVVAPVADYIEVDPYLYLMYRAYYENTLSANMTPSELAAGFAAWYFEHYEVRFEFTEIYASTVPEEDTPDEVGSFTWNFDYIDGNEIYTESNIDNRHTGVQAGSDSFAPEYTYVYTVFHNQVIAIGIEILPREFVAVYVPGEEALNTYTVDALEPDTYTLPTDLVYIFREMTVDGTYLYYVFDPTDYEYAYVGEGAEQVYIDQRAEITALLSDYLGETVAEESVNSLFVTLSDEGTDFTADPLGAFSSLGVYGAPWIIQWTNPVADRVFLVGNDGNPFAGYDGNVTNSYIGFANYFDPDRNWYHTVRGDNGTVVTEWFRTETATIAVLVPDKTVGGRDYAANTTIITGSTVGNTATTIQVMNVVPAGGTWDDRGVYNVDPYDMSTWVLSPDITVYFDDTDEDGNPAYDPRNYSVTWTYIGESHMNGVDFTEEVRSANGSAEYFTVTATIGSGEQTMTITLLVQLMSAYMDNIVFSANGNAMTNETAAPSALYEGGHMVESQTAEYDGAGFQLRDYTYYVDTYYRFPVPDSVTVTFTDRSVRSYPLEWADHAPWAPGTVGDSAESIVDNEITVTSAIGDGIDSVITLMHRVEAKQIFEMTIAPADEALQSAGVTFTVNTTAKTISVNMNGRVYLICDPELADGDDIGVIGVYGADGELAAIYHPYDFFAALFGNIELSFTDTTKPHIFVTDAATSAEAYIMSTLDTQKIASESGQQLDIYIGQGMGADDYTVTLAIGYRNDSDRYSIEFSDEQFTDFEGTAAWSDSLNAVVMDITVEAYTDANEPAYPAGYDIAAMLPSFWLRRGNSENAAENSATLYGGAGAALPAVWYVEAPAAYGGNTDYADYFWGDEFTADGYTRMYGFERYDAVSVLPWEDFAMGGRIWLTAMLSDGSRIYVSVNVPMRDIGRDFHSVSGDTSRLTIINGAVTIDDYYAYYPLAQNLTVNNLPTRIAIGANYGDDTLIRTNISWRMLVSGSDIAAITYNGTGGEIPFATAMVMGREITLYLDVLPAVVNRVSLETANVSADRHFTSHWREDDSITIDIDPYVQTGYGGVFSMPTSSYSLTLWYGTESDAEPRRFAYPLTLGTGAYSGTNSYAYTYDGEGDASFKMTLADGQVVNVNVNFLDKTVTGIIASNDHDGMDDMRLTIDPYTDDIEDITVHPNVTLRFSEGVDIEYTFTWTYLGANIPTAADPGTTTVELTDAPFEVMYDTYQRLFFGNDAGHFLFASSIDLGGIAAQEIAYEVRILDRLLRTYTIAARQNWDSYENRTSPNASYVYSDPFKGRASDLYGTVTGLTAANTQYEENVVWNFADTDITAEGTLANDGGYMLVSGYVDNASRGQPVYIKVYVEPWTFEAIRRPVGSDYQIMTGESLRFVISSITGLSATDHFEVAFAVTRISVDPLTGALSGGQRSENLRIPFVAEGIDPATVTYNGTNADFGGTLDPTHGYILYFNDEAVAEAERNGTSTGEYYLGNNAGRENIVTRIDARYEYERPAITQIDLGYGFGTQNNAIYVVNPLDPAFGDTNGMSVGAIGTYNSDYERLLTGSAEEGGAGFTATLEWIGTSIPAAYLGGGVVRDWTVRITLTNAADPGFSYSEEFAIMMVFLDMSPLDYISGDAGNILISNVRSVYNESSYLGEYNPYADVYMRDLVGNTVDSSGKNVLETAVDALGVGDKRISYNVNAWDTRVYTSGGVSTRYSTSVTIFDTRYNTNIVERRWSVNGYRIEDFDLTYDLMISDSENEGAVTETELLILNPLDPGNYSVNIANVTGNNLDSVTGATYELVWWDAENQGAFTANGAWLGGALIDDWTARVVMRDASGEIVYIETVTIAVAFMDVLPSSVYVDGSAQGAPAAPPRTSYAADTYGTDTENNPYGSYYTAVASDNSTTLYTMLTRAANSTDVLIGDKAYYYAITWGSDGRSSSVTVYEGTNPDGKSIGTYYTNVFVRL